MAAMFTATAHIKKAVALINDLDTSKFPLLLSRILQKLHIKEERTFSEGEEEKLQDALGLTGSDLELIIETLEFILQQAAYHAAKPQHLSQQLQQLDLEGEKIRPIVEAWSSSARETIGKLRQRTVHPKQLEEVNWRLNLQLAQSSRSKMKEPNAMFEFGVRDENSGEKDKIRMEFTHDELYGFYNQLETIQKQLDSLS
ncbi:COMM domain-containing protein 10-like [Babylonia areolata]|uniref:COMM domain-containing protein 10-like n=1 Tax=Babylonia areolata TaxID=304850 RepID=UPI003FD3CB45